MHPHILRIWPWGRQVLAINAHNCSVFLFTFLGMGAGPLQLGEIRHETSKLGKIACNTAAVSYKINNPYMHQSDSNLNINI